MRAFYFNKKDKKLRYGDNRQIRKGRTHKVKGEIELCKYGLHASVNIMDALEYAPGSYLWLVELGGEIKEGGDKVVATERTYIDGFDATELLREFTRKQALINIEKIYKYCSQEDYDLIIEYLNTGDEELRSAALSAALSTLSEELSAALSAERSAALSAALSALSAERSAALSAERSAARSAARSARSAARSAALSAERSAALSARSAAEEMLLSMIREKMGWDV